MNIPKREKQLLGVGAAYVAAAVAIAATGLVGVPWMLALAPIWLPILAGVLWLVGVWFITRPRH